MTHNGVMVKVSVAGADVHLNALNITAIQPAGQGVCRVWTTGGQDFTAAIDAEQLAAHVANAVKLGK